MLSLVRETTPYTLPAPDPIPGIAIYEYTAEITPITLAANTLYWLSITNHTGRIWGWLNDDTLALATTPSIPTVRSGSPIRRATPWCSI